MRDLRRWRLTPRRCVLRPSAPAVHLHKESALHAACPLPAQVWDLLFHVVQLSKLVVVPTAVPTAVVAPTAAAGAGSEAPVVRVCGRTDR